MKYFADVRGAIDGTHIAAYIPVKFQTPFRNRKRTLSQNVLAGCTFDMHFFYILPGWEGSANDSRVLDNAILRGFPQLPGHIYLADAGCGMRPGILTPYKGVRYHFREQAKSARAPATKEELVNLRNAQLRNVIERIFSVLKKSFQILQGAPQYEYNVRVGLNLIFLMHYFKPLVKTYDNV